MPQPLANLEFDALAAAGPTVLIADDDRASCRFLCDGVRSLGARAEAFHDGTSALERAREYAFDLLMLDCRMPGGGALHILSELHKCSVAQSANSVAVATTAELDPGDREKLLAAGFRHILMKPCELADLRTVLTLVNPRSSSQTLDDEAALTATGDATTMRALRLLLREELAILERDLDTLSPNATALSDRLHRLRSSCGFCGATALCEQTVLLQQQLVRAAPAVSALASFRRSLSTTLLALDR